MKTYGGAEVKLHAPAVFSPGKQPQYPLYRRPGVPQAQSGSYLEEKTLLPVPVIEPRFVGRALSVAALTTDCMLYLASCCTSIIAFCTYV
jgi:hypothetical protein